MKAKLDDKVQLLADLVNKQRSNASTSDIPEYEYMKTEQAKVDMYNTEQRWKKLQGRKHKLTPARLFPYKKLLRDNKKSGLDFAWYVFEVYMK